MIMRDTIALKTCEVCIANKYDLFGRKTSKGLPLHAKKVFNKLKQGLGLSIAKPKHGIAAS